MKWQRREEPPILFTALIIILHIATIVVLARGHNTQKDATSNTRNKNDRGSVINDSTSAARDTR